MLKINYKPIGNDSIRPICPHCEREIDADIPYFEQSPGPSGMNLGNETARLFICPNCHKVLAIGTVN